MKGLDEPHSKLDPTACRENEQTRPPYAISGLRPMGVEAPVRPSLAFYNTCEDIDALVAALLHLQARRAHRKL